MPKSAFLVNVRPETASRSLNALLRLTSQSFDLLLLVVIGLLLLHCVHAEKTASSPFCVPGKNNIVDKDSLVLENNISADLEIRDVEPDLATYNRLTEQYRQVFLDGKKVIINHQIQISSSLKFKSSCSIHIPRRAQYVSFLSVWIEKVSVEHMKLSDAQGLPLAESISFHSDHLNAIMAPTFFFHDENRFDYAPLLFVTIGSKHRRVEIPRAGIYYNYQDRTFETYIELGREASATAMQINPWSSVTPQSGDALHDWLGQLMSGTLPVLDGYEAEDKQAELKSLGWFIISCEEIVSVPSVPQRGEFTPARDHVAISVSHGHKIALQYESILPKQNVLIFSTGNIMNCEWKQHNSNMMLIVLHEIDSNHKIILTSYAPIMSFHEPLSKPFGTHFRWKTQCFGSMSRAFQLHPDTRKILMTITSPRTDAIYIDPILVLYEGSPFPFWAIIVIIVAGSLVLTLLGAVLWRCCCNRPGSEQTESPNHGFTELAVCSSTV